MFYYGQCDSDTCDTFNVIIVLMCKHTLISGKSTLDSVLKLHAGEDRAEMSVFYYLVLRNSIRLKEKQPFYYIFIFCL